MVLVSTHFDDGRIKIRISSALGSQLWVKLDKNLQLARVWYKNIKIKKIKKVLE